jgi:hypothetical protein
MVGARVVEHSTEGIDRVSGEEDDSDIPRKLNQQECSELAELCVIRTTFLSLA